MFNFASMSDIVAGNESRAVGFALDFFRSRQVPWAWVVTPSSQPGNLSERLLEYGFTSSHQSPGMALDLHGGHYNVAAEIVEVLDDLSLEVWLDAFADAFPMPVDIKPMFRTFHKSAGWKHLPLRYFYAVSEGMPVATASVFYGAGVAGLYSIGTIPDARRRGFAAKVTEACLAAAVEDGYDVAILQSSRMGLPLYEKLGFKEHCRLEYFLPPEPESPNSGQIRL